MKYLLPILCLFIFSCDDDDNPMSSEIEGCIDWIACNYDDTAILDDESCTYAEEYFDCDGYCLVDVDECGVCNGNNSTCLGCDGEINSGLVDDECGVCNGNNESMDCGGSCNNENVELLGECYNIEETTNLNLGWNQLTGEIPSEIGILTNLTHLYLYSNQFTGQIPEEIGNLTNLETLSLGDNQLTGEIPSEIGDLTNLTSLDLSDNQFTGLIPSEIGQLTNLTGLYLSDNQLTGLIPEEICNQGDGTPSVANNKLCPLYPSCISQSDIDTQDTSNCP